jgi:hypothetical protein
MPTEWLFDSRHSKDLALLHCVQTRLRATQLHIQCLPGLFSQWCSDRKVTLTIHSRLISSLWMIGADLHLYIYFHVANLDFISVYFYWHFPNRMSTVVSYKCATYAVRLTLHHPNTTRKFQFVTSSSHVVLWSLLGPLISLSTSFSYTLSTQL